jgi:hypothetical protein
VDGSPERADPGEVLARLPIQLSWDCRQRLCVIVVLGAGKFRCQGEHHL